MRDAGWVRCGANPVAALAAIFAIGCGGSRPSSSPIAKPAAVTPVASVSPGAPATDKKPVTDTYHGVSVTDDYRWLEESGSPSVRAWSAAQNARARAYLGALPDFARIGARVAEVYKHASASYPLVIPRGGRWFVLKYEPPRQQPLLVVMDGPNAPQRVLVDLNVVDAAGKTSIDWFVPSPDGRLLAVSLSRAGTEMGDLSVLEVATGKALPDAIPRVNGGTAGGDLAWLENGSGFFYTRYPRPGQRPDADLHFYQQVYFHALGTPEASDRYELGDGFPKIAEIQLEVEQATGRVLASVQDGDGGQFSHHVRDPGGKWHKVTDFADGVKQVEFGVSGELYLLSRAGAPRGKILRLGPNRYDLSKAETLVPEGSDTLVTTFWGEGSFLATATHFYTTYQLGGPSEVRAFDLRGKPARWQSPVDVASSSGLARDGKGAVLFQSESFLVPAAWYRFDEKTRTTNESVLADASPFDTSGYEVVRETATSADGTRVPLNVLLPRGTKLDGSNPCVVTGYGGYGESLEPRFRRDTGIWLEQGVIFVVANVRGGGEFGDEWHRQGQLERKQNVFDDFAAVLSHLVQRGYTRPSRLGIIGGSNGGLLMGAMLTQHPNRFKAAVSYVGIYDMLRVELSPNGAFNVTEFGTVKNPEQFAALYAYSPYHRVKDGVAYPATLLVTGENDPRVDPMQSRKMAARLQAATSSEGPILFRSSSDVGHGGDMALDERVAQKVDAFAFMLHELGVSFKSR